jgi:hypothetical protein
VKLAAGNTNRSIRACMLVGKTRQLYSGVSMLRLDCFLRLGYLRWRNDRSRSAWANTYINMPQMGRLVTEAMRAVGDHPKNEVF